MAQTQTMSGGAMIVLAIILALLIWLLPGLIYIYAWLLVILLFISGLIAILMK